MTVEPINVTTGNVEVLVLADGRQYLSQFNAPPFGQIEIPIDDPTEVSNVQELFLQVRFQNDGVAGRTIRLTDFRTVPEPTTGLLVVTGLAGLAVRRRRLH